VPIVRTLFEHFKHIQLHRWGPQVRIAGTTRLLPRFGVRFLARPEHRIYLRVGERCMLNSSITFESTEGLVEVGNRTYIGSGTHIISRNHVRIGDDVTMAWAITIYDHNSHSFDWRLRRKTNDHFYCAYGTRHCFEELDWADVKSAPITIGDRVWIGFGAVILKGVTIGEGAIIGACSVVARDVEPYTVVAGNPATPVRRIQPPIEGAPRNAARGLSAG
jgi:acetyltransferase-like isoleucine patch superfamily enzyme